MYEGVFDGNGISPISSVSSRCQSGQVRQPVLPPEVGDQPIYLMHPPQSVRRIQVPISPNRDLVMAIPAPIPIPLPRPILPIPAPIPVPIPAPIPAPIPVPIPIPVNVPNVVVQNDQFQDVQFMRQYVEVAPEGLPVSDEMAAFLKGMFNTSMSVENAELLNRHFVRRRKLYDL